MARFTQDNTNGFTDADISILNAALDRIKHCGISDDMNRISDKLNNLWFEGVTIEQLVTMYLANR